MYAIFLQYNNFINGDIVIIYSQVILGFKVIKKVVPIFVKTSVFMCYLKGAQGKKYLTDFR